MILLCEHPVITGCESAQSEGWETKPTARRSGATTTATSSAEDCNIKSDPSSTPAVVGHELTQKHRLIRKIFIYDAEGKLPERIFPKILEVDWPAQGSFSDSCYRLLNRAVKVNRGNGAALSIPAQCSQILLFRLQMKSKRLTCHAAAYVPCAGLLP